MLDAATKRKIDSARQILVGKVPDPKQQVDQITTALVYKFMDDMDKESEELGGKAKFFTNGFEKYSWTKLMDKRLSGQQRLDLYVQAITNMSRNPHLPQLFREIFKGAFLPYNDPETLSLFLKEINGFTYDHSENLGDAFEYLLSILGSQGEAGQFRTPRHIIDFIVEVVDPKKDETILDPACGTAGFLISAYKHILKQNKDKPLTPDEKKRLMSHFVGYDISPDMVKLSLVNLYLHGFPTPQIYEYDTLTSEKYWNEHFDVIMANPPFMTPKGGIRPHKRFSVQARRSEVLFVDYILEHLNIKGRAGVIVPEGIIFKSENAYKQLRQMLLKDGLFAVVSLPPGVFNPYSGVKTSILFLDNQLAKKTDEILFLKIENDGFDLGAQRRKIDKNDLPEALEILKAWKKGRKQKSNLALWVKKNKIAESGDYNLIGERYRETEVRKNQKWPSVLLKDVAFFQEGPGILSSQYTQKGYPIINVRNVQDGYLDLSETKFVTEEMANGRWAHFQIQSGDILFTTSGTIGRVARVKKEDLPLLLNTSVVRFRPLDEKQLDTDYLFYILKSKKFVDSLLRLKTGSAQFNVGPTHLKQLSIPLPPLEVQKEIVEQIEVKQKVIEAAKAVIENLERERRYFGQELRKLKDVEWVELGNTELFKIESGGTPDTKEPEYWDGSINWVTLVDLPHDNFITEVESTKRKITEKGLANSSAVLLPVDTILVSSRATIGRVAIAKKPTATNQGFKNIIVKDKKRVLSYFVAICMTTKVDEMTQVATGGTFKEIPKSKFEKLKIPLPPLEIQKQLVAEMENQEKIIEANKNLIEIMEKKIEDVLSTI